MRFTLRTLMILLAVLPPLLAGAWLLSQEFPWLLPIASCFAVFWLMCGVVWMAIMRCLERFLEERHD